MAPSPLTIKMSVLIAIHSRDYFPRRVSNSPAVSRYQRLYVPIFLSIHFWIEKRHKFFVM